MRISLPTTALLLSLAAPSVCAFEEKEGDWYLNFGLGAVFPDDEDIPSGGSVSFDTGITVAAAVGRVMGVSDAFRWSLEIEGLYTDTNLDDDDLGKIPSATEKDADNLAWMLNAVLDYQLTRQVDLYLGGGIGYASDIDYKSFDQGNLNLEDKDAVAFQGKAGFKYHLGGRYDLLVGYRYFRTDKLEVKNRSNGSNFHLDNINHIVEIGVRWGL